MKIKKLLEKVMPIIDGADLYDENGKHIDSAEREELIQNYGKRKVKRVTRVSINPLNELYVLIVVKR